MLCNKLQIIKNIRVTYLALIVWCSFNLSKQMKTPFAISYSDVFIVISKNLIKIDQSTRKIFFVFDYCDPNDIEIFNQVEEN
jgi:hypothetical protein